MGDDVIKIGGAGGSGELPAYLVEPESGERRPGIVLIQEVFGVNAYVRSVARELAGQGYRVCAPDLFWRIEPGIELDPGDEEARNKAKALRKAFDRSKGLEDCGTVAAFLRRSCPRIGVVGFCMGGRLAYHMAVGTDADACVAYYGTGIHTVLDLAGDLTTPLLLHIAEDDHLCDAEARSRIYDVLGPNDTVELHAYAGVGHAFARPGGKTYNAEAAALAHRRTADFLGRHLSP